MNWKWNYGDSVIVLPAAVLSANATPEQIRVLMWLANDAELAGKPAQLAKLADCPREEIENAIAFWQSCDVLSGGDPSARKVATVKKVEKPAAPAKAPSDTAETKAGKTQHLQRADELPVYTSAELADMMEQRASLRLLADESQRIFGKMFNLHELNILFGLVDYLKLDEEFILLLLEHCKKIGIKSMRQVERCAISLIDSGVETAAALEERVQILEAAHTLEGQIRSMFGLKSRALSAKEKKMLENWSSYGYGEEMIRRAYEITVNTTGEASLPYTNSILERWHSDGVNTPDDADRKQLERSAQKSAPSLGSSFDTDDFFEAALQRSFRTGEEQGQKKSTP